jgi:hypothetical protein
MKEFQKIAIGLLGLTHPEMFIQKPKPDQSSNLRVDATNARGAARRVRSREGRLIRAVKSFRFILGALAIGSRTVPLADNGQLRRELRAWAGLLYGAGED